MAPPRAGPLPAAAALIGVPVVAPSVAGAVASGARPDEPRFAPLRVLLPRVGGMGRPPLSMRCRGPLGPPSRSVVQGERRVLVSAGGSGACRRQKSRERRSAHSRALSELSDTPAARLTSRVPWLCVPESLRVCPDRSATTLFGCPRHSAPARRGLSIPCVCSPRAASHRGVVGMACGAAARARAGEGGAMTLLIGYDVESAHAELTGRFLDALEEVQSRARPGPAAAPAPRGAGAADAGVEVLRRHRGRLERCRQTQTRRVHAPHGRRSDREERHDRQHGGELPPAREVIDAAGLHVLPGLIDPHVHFRVPGLEYKEDFDTGSQGAACGGITTVIDMPNVVPPTATVEAFQAKAAAARGRSYVDYGLYAVIVEGNSDQILPLADAGVVGYKIFLGETVGAIPAPQDGEIIDAWRIVAQTGLRCGVHAEDNGIILYLRKKLQAQGRTDPLAHLESRPAVAEAEAISRAILFAREAGSKLMIFHMSAAEGVELVRRGKDSGVDVMGETAPHYLIMEAEDMVRMGLGSLLKVNPPVRSREHAEALWRGLLDGTIEVIGTDHAPHTPEEKMAEQPMGDIWKALAVWPGVETNVPLMLTQVSAGRMSLNHYVKVQAEGAARAWNLWPRKGHLGRGADADITIVDLQREGVIDKDKLHSKSKVTPFHGFRVRGMPVYTIVRGHVVMKHGELYGDPIGELLRPIV